jgi:hypothetical protein
MKETKLTFEDWGTVVFGWVFMVVLGFGLLYVGWFFAQMGLALTVAFFQNPLGFLSAAAGGFWMGFSQWAGEFFPNIHLVAFNLFYGLRWIIAPAAGLVLFAGHGPARRWQTALCWVLLIASSLCIFDSFQHPATGGYIDYGSRMPQWVDE